MGCICLSFLPACSGQGLGKAGLSGLFEGCMEKGWMGIRVGRCSLGFCSLLLSPFVWQQGRSWLVCFGVCSSATEFFVHGPCTYWYGATTMGRAWLDHILVEQTYVVLTFACMAAI
ncbi:hypothetical protein K469DRAFT_199420 [Zopfia rhizophila CBS 207.26]|uniref:Uncharacterized protein n=1 Tax=Zopfia rhizophila CBS 207.26 TaxID=1314779 RepID=A0A6A6E0C2_9PEZI|nr:hypothetical protein K469DRAFT_199420 [Zopfia rhizophila CBS 207.26]